MSAVDLTLQLDARQPFLNDHRPGGLPLLGTAMGIELMARAAQQLDGNGAMSAWSIADVEILDALVLDGPTATVHVRAEQAEAASNGSIRCVVESRRETGAPIRHFVGFVQRRQGETIAASVRYAGARQPTAVSQDTIYRTFFHGPAFRVIRSAWLLEAAMVCEFAVDLPPLSMPIDQTRCAPRWIELCMQTAGLLEIAAASRMMIPRRIERIDVTAADGSAAAGPCVACARRSVSPATGDAAFDVELVDALGVVLVRVTGYHTRPLPYPADPEAVRALHRAFGQAPTML